MLILSDDVAIKNVVNRGVCNATFVTYARLMKTKDVDRLFRDVKIFWFDLPRGGRWRATKIKQIEKLYTTVLGNRPDMCKACILPAKAQWPSQFPQHRWQQLLANGNQTQPRYVTVA